METKIIEMDIVTGDALDVEIAATTPEIAFGYKIGIIEIMVQIIKITGNNNISANSNNNGLIRLQRPENLNNGYNKVNNNTNLLIQIL